MTRKSALSRLLAVVGEEDRDLPDRADARGRPARVAGRVVVGEGGALSREHDRQARATGDVG